MEARGNAGTSIRQRITFLTNDPRHPEFSIDGLIHEVTGGVTAVPSTVFAGELLPGATSEADFDILDGAAVARRLDHLEAPSPHTVSVVSTQRQDVWVEGKRVGARIGRGHVNSVAPLQAGPFSYKVSIFLRDVARQPDVFEIHGVVKPAVKFQPSALMLPRATPNGPVYRRTVRLTNNLPSDCVVAVKDAPPHLRLALPALLKAGQSLDIEVSADVPANGKPLFGELLILATSGKESHEQSVRYRITQ